MPAWHEPATRAIGARIVQEVCGEAPMVDPDGNVFDRAIDKALTPGSGRLAESAQLRARGARGQSAVDPEVADLQVELGQRGTNLRTVAHEAHLRGKAKAQGGRGRVDAEYDEPAEEEEYEDEYEPDEEYGPPEERELPDHIAAALEDEDEEAPPPFTIPEARTGDPYSGLEGSLGFMDDARLGELAVAVQNDPSLTAARRFELSERIGRAYASR